MLVIDKCHQETAFIVFYLFMGFLSVQAKEPPRLASPHYEAVVHGRISDNIRLTCPVESSSPSKLLFSWTKDDESISGTWVRFVSDGPHLVIEDLEVDDSGLYMCMAINGYGSQQAAIRLIVTDPSESFSETSAEYANNLEPEKIMKDLNFTDDTYTQSKLILLASGGSLRLGCSVTGYPFPDLLWFKNEVLVDRLDRNQLDETETLDFPLSVQGASVDSSGNYTCLALGLKARIQITFTIKVLDAKKNVPDMIEVEPHNRTERRGGTGKLLCWIYSLGRPEAEWFKLLPDDGHRHQRLDANASLVIGRDHYQRLESNETVKKHDGSFLRQLILHPLDDKHAGCYLCMATNKFGYNMRRTCLIVEPNYETNESKSVPFSIMVALPSGLILGLAAGFVCWLRERERLRRLAEAGVVDSSHRQQTAATDATVEGQQQQQQQQHTSSELLHHQRITSGRQALTSSPGSQQQAPGGSLVSVSSPSVITDGGSSSFDQQANYYFDNQHRRNNIMPRRL